MELKEKYEEYKDLFFKEMIFRKNEDPNEQGSYIPTESINGEKLFVGDGTINMSHYLIYLSFLNYKNKNDHMNDEIYRVLLSLKRLSFSAYNRYKEMYPNIEFKEEKGFFFRDDIDDCCFDKDVISAYMSETFYEDEDPCFSPFVSQDQIWNLAPILMYLQSVSTTKIANSAKQSLGEMLYYVINNGHKIYNPYFSTIKHYWTFVPSMNEKKVAPWNRKKNREENVKYDIKVKRGANNWYYAYGFRKTYNKLKLNSISKWKSFWYGVLYYPLIFLADRVWFPMLKVLFGKSTKDNSYYSLSVSGDCWYSTRKRFLKRLKSKFNKDPFSYWNTLIVECMKTGDFSNIDINRLQSWLDSFIIPCETSASKVLEFMILYELYDFLKNNSEIVAQE